MAIGTGLARENTSPVPKLAYPIPRRQYRAYVAGTKEERHAAYRLRFRVFNLELNEGLERAYQTGEDLDEFDVACDHVIVEDRRTGSVVGTYRMQSGMTAARHLGYYSAREFDFRPYESLRRELIELGRACIHPEHRGYEVLMLLWKTIFHYACDSGARYLIGCSSVSSQDHQVAAAVYDKLQSSLVPEQLRTVPTPEYACALHGPALQADPPKLLRAYLALGAFICGPPALDREFKTIDFLTLMDLNNLSPAIRNRFHNREER